MAKKSKYQHLSREQLEARLEKLEKEGYGLKWEDKPEEVATKCDTELPLLKENVKREIVSDPNLPYNFIIEGDNYHSLFTLNFTHRKKIDVIYIDPPYNTGKKNEWKYNDHWVDENDTYRHSKWLSFMNKRLRLAKNLLKNDGVIFISIDDNEVAQLKLLCDKIFGEKNLIGIITVAKGTTTGQDGKKFGSSIDYLIVYGKPDFELGKIELTEKDRKRFSKEDGTGLYSILQWRKTGSGDKRVDRPNLFYPLESPEKTEIFPYGPDGYESRWRGDLKKFKYFQKNNMVEWVKQEDTWKPYIKYYLEGRKKSPSNLWTDVEGNKKATIELKLIFGETIFKNPKPTDLIKKCIELSNSSSPIVLDFFAGSGTTAQSILELNRDKNYDATFILCTNNENNICTDVTYPRIQKVIGGYANVDGIKANVKYFNQIHVNNVYSDKDKRDLVARSTELLCLAENTFEKINSKIPSVDFAIFKNLETQTAIIYDENEIDNCVKVLNDLDNKLPTVIYVFSYDHTYNLEDFENLKIEFTVKPIPDAILNVYRKIAKLRKK